MNHDAPTRFHITPELKSLASFVTFEGSFEPQDLDLGPDVYHFVRPVSFDVTLTNTGGSILATGSAQAQAQVDCARCAEPFVISLEGEVSNYYVFEHAVDECELEDDEYDLIGANDVIDLEDALLAALILDTPLIPLHDEACKGLCSQCGCNLNIESCGCSNISGEVPYAEPDAAQHPFAALANLKLEVKE